MTANFKDETFPFIFGSAYLKLPRDPQPWIIQDLVPLQGLINVYAQPKIGKSFFALGVAEAIANDKVNSFLGYPVRKHGKVLYFQIDTPRSFWADRIEGIVGTNRYDISNIGFADRLMAPRGFNILDDVSKLWLMENVEAVDPILVILDTLRELHSGDENDATAMKNVVTAVVECIPNAAVMFISHSRKSFQNMDESITEGARGSGYIAGRMDSIIKMTQRQVAVQSRAGSDEIEISQDPDCGMIVRKFTDRNIINFVDYLMYAYKDLPPREIVKILAFETGCTEEVARSTITRWEQEKERRKANQSQLTESIL